MTLTTEKTSSLPVRPVPRGLMVLFAGGGSGGHISPGLAIAERLKELDPESQAFFLCSQRSIDKVMLDEAGAKYTSVPASPPSIHPIKAMRFLLNFRRSKRNARKIFRELGVTYVVALGGFVAAPVVSAARACRIPILLINLDNPPGKANRWMARRCVDVVTAIELPDLPNFATSIVGMPVRRRALAPAPGIESGQIQACRSQLGLEPDRQTLLVTGASQGSTSINEFIVAMAEREPDVFEGWQILHLAGTGAEEDLEQRYETTGVPAQVRPFLHDMGLAWGAADLALSRAGASSVAEAACNSVPTIFLPYPYHRDMHQKFNARRMVEMGGALLETDAIEVEANLKRIGPRLRELMTNPLKLLAMRSVLRSNVPPDAALIVARMLIEKSC